VGAQVAEHLRAYLEISEIWDDAPLVDRERTGSREELVAKAKDGAEVVSLGESFTRHPTPGPPRSLRTRFAEYRLATAAAVGVVACGVAAFLGYQHYRAPLYSTGIGEQRLVTLADGSRVELNSRTQLSVHFTDTERDVELLEGQALFNVAKDPQRPFIVRSRNLAVRAVGTEFDVDRKKDTTTVTVLEGRVAVRFGSAEVSAPAPIMVAAGEQVTGTVHARSPLRASRANVVAATAWTHGTLVFEGSTLADVVEEFNRHNERLIVLADPTLGNMQISGVYASTDPEILLRFLREQPHVRVDETPARIVISSR